MSISVGLIGFGLSGRIFHAPFILNNKSMSLDCVYSSKPEEVVLLAPNARVVSESETLISDESIDLVVITSPNALHFPLAKAALLAGKHVLLEKPSVTNLADIEALCSLAASKNLILSVYQNRRFDGDFIRLMELANSSTIGKIKYMESRFDRFRPNVQDRWREQPGEGTGIFWDLGPHLLDQMLCLFGEPLWVQASMSKLREKSETTDFFNVELGYEDKSIRIASSPFEAGEQVRFKVNATGGSWHCFGLDPQESALRAGQMPSDAAFPNRGDVQSAILYQANSQGEIEVVKEPLTLSLYSEFYDSLSQAILEEGTAPVGLADACKLIYGLELAEQSSLEGVRLPWKYSSLF